jgi:hypothetical protein
MAMKCQMMESEKLDVDWTSESTEELKCRRKWSWTFSFR